MLRRIFIGALGLSALAISSAAFAQATSGSAAEAKAMLEKAVAAVKADKAKALAAFESGTDGFKDRDLYPFCFNIADGVTVAGPASVRGKDVRTLKDASGKAFGEDLYKGAQDGAVAEVPYMFPRPGQTEPAAKISFVTKAGDLGCGVGYYK
jgi:signal transduction histidine kinase